MAEHPATLLKRIEGRARRRFGQHFLASPGVVQRIVSVAGVRAGDRVLEIGPGLGVLTEALLEAGAEVTAVELDRDLAAFLAARFPGLRLIEGDAARQDWASLLPGGGWKCVSNLPYNVGTKLVTEMVCQPQTFARLVVMLQKEVAARMVAPAGDRKRGSLSVHMEAHAATRLALKVPPGAFHPPPRVDSAVIVADLFEEPRTGGVPSQRFEAVVRVAFSAPRKSLRNALRSGFARERIAAALQAADLDGGRRAATITVEEFQRLVIAIA